MVLGASRFLKAENSLSVSQEADATTGIAIVTIRGNFTSLYFQNPNVFRSAMMRIDRPKLI